MNLHRLSGRLTRIQFKRARGTLRQLAILAFFLDLSGNGASGGLVQPVSVPYSAEVPDWEGAGDSVTPILSPDGRFVLFSSSARNLVVDVATNPFPASFPRRMDVFLRDRASKTTTLVSKDPAGTGGGNGDSFPSGLSADGRYVLFESGASNLVSGDTNCARDVFLRDVLTSITSIVSGSTNGAPGNGQSHDAVMTSDARYIAFVSEANNLVANDTNRISDVFVRDMVSQTTVLASVGGSSRQFQYRAFGSASPLLSGDGRYVAFFSTASELLPGADSTEAIWIRDLLTRATTCVSADARREANSVFGWTNASAFNHVLSADGRFVAYEATASPRSNDMPGLILRYDSLMGTTEVLATNANVASGALEDIQSLAMTPDGQFIAYVANGSAPASTNTCIEVWDARRGTTILASGDADGKVPVGSMCAALAIDLTGRYVSFMSTGLNLVTNALRGEYHLYRFDLQSNVTSLLDLDDQGAGLGVSPGSAPSLSADGELVAFESGPDASMELGRNRSSQVYLRDLRSNSMELISVRDAALPALAPRGQSTFGRPSLSGDGRFVAFSSDADNLVPGDTNRCTDVFVRDCLLGTNLLVTTGLDGAAANGASAEPSVSADGRYVAFSSTADNLVPGDTNRSLDVFLRDLSQGTIALVSVGPDGSAFGNGDSHSPWLSSDGRYLAFISQATNLTADSISSTNENLFLRDMQSGSTLALTKGGVSAFSMTADGHFVAFGTLGPFNSGLFLWDTQLSSLVFSNSTWDVSAIAVSPDGTRIVALVRTVELRFYDRAAGTNWYMGLTGGGCRLGLRFSADSRLLAYATASPQTAGDTNNVKDVFIYDFQTSSNYLVSRTFARTSGNNASDYPDISPDGRFVAYHSFASDLVPGDLNGTGDVFVFDRQSGTTTLLSADGWAAQSVEAASMSPAFSLDGRHLIFESWGSRLTQGDFNSSGDLFVADLDPSGSISSFQATVSCDPAYPGVLTVTWFAVSGKTYRVQFKDRLDAPQWQDVTATITVVGNQGCLRDVAPGTATRFYRVLGF